MNTIPEAYKQAAQHVKDKTPIALNLKEKKVIEDKLIVCASSFFVRYDRSKYKKF